LNLAVRKTSLQNIHFHARKHLDCFSAS